MAKHFVAEAAKVCLKLQYKRLLAAFRFVGLIAGSHICLLSLLLLNGDIGLGGSGQDLGKFGVRLQWFGVFRSKAKHNHLSPRTAPSLMSVSAVEGFNRVDLKLVHVRDHSSGTPENAECATLSNMVQDCGITRLHLLITALSLAGVVKAAIGLPTVVITMRLAGLRIRKDQDVWRLPRRANSSLSSPAKLFVESPPLNARAWH